jgi:hypothetical protein
MNTENRSLIPLRIQKTIILDCFFAIVGSTVATLILMPISKDFENYLALFKDMRLSLEGLDFSITSESLFWGWLQLIANYGGELSLALFPIVLLTFFMKLRAFRFLGFSYFYMGLCYLSIFYLLHEGTQVRISSALAFSLWSCIWMVQSRWWLAFLFGLLSLGFHLTGPLLPMIFFCCYQSVFFRRISWLALAAGVLAFTLKLSVMDLIARPVFELLGGRYLDYGNDALLETQNTSGGFALFLSALLLLLHYWKRLNPRHNTHLFSTCLAVCVYGVALMFWFYDTLAVASRLGEMLNLLIIPLLAIAISTSQAAFRYLSLSILLLFFAMRIIQLF